MYIQKTILCKEAQSISKITKKERKAKIEELRNKGTVIDEQISVIGWIEDFFFIAPT